MAPQLNTFSNGRYEQSIDISDIRDTSYVDVKDLQTIIVEDTKDSKYRTLRLARHGSKSHEWLTTHIAALKQLSISGPHPTILAPVDTFEATVKGTQYLGVIYEELLGPDLEATRGNGDDPDGAHKPEVVRHYASQALKALVVVHDGKMIADGSNASLVPTYPGLAKSNEKAIQKFYGFDGGSTNFNGSCTGPVGSPLDLDALQCKLDRLNPTGSYSKNYVPEAIFKDELTPKCDLWMLGSVLLNLAACSPEEVYGILHFTPQSARDATDHLPPSLYRGLLNTIGLLGKLPKKFVERLPRDARSLVESNAVKYDDRALYKAITDNYFVQRLPEEQRMSGADVDSLVELLKQLLAHDPEQRPEPRAALELDFFQSS